jgi:hypothetical protein
MENIVARIISNLNGLVYETNLRSGAEFGKLTKQ